MIDPLSKKAHATCLTTPCPECERFASALRETTKLAEKAKATAENVCYPSGPNAADWALLENTQLILAALRDVQREGQDATTKEVDTERRRWYAAFPSAGDLEGLAPEVAAEHIERVIVQQDAAWMQHGAWCDFHKQGGACSCGLSTRLQEIEK